MLHLLAPVPAVHLPSAWETFTKEGRVAFGSNAFDVLHSLAGDPVTVWIVASATDAPSDGVSGWDIGKIVVRGRLADIATADRRGQHPDAKLRPASTLDDSEWHYGQFWEVEGLERLIPARSVIGLKTEKGQNLQGTPRGPIRIRPPSWIAKKQ